MWQIFSGKALRPQPPAGRATLRRRVDPRTQDEGGRELRRALLTKDERDYPPALQHDDEPGIQKSECS